MIDGSKSEYERYRQRHISADDSSWLPRGYHFVEDIGTKFLSTHQPNDGVQLAELAMLADNIKGEWYWFMRNVVDRPITDWTVYLYVLVCDASDATLYRLASNAKPIGSAAFASALAGLPASNS